MSRLMYSVVSGVWVCLAGICAFGPGTTIASTPQTQYTTTRIPAPDPQVGGRWGERVASAGDINHDGVPDFFVGEPSYASGSLTTAGRVYLIEGKTGKPLYHIDSPEPQAKAKFGFFISVPGDLNRDGKNDIVIGTDQQTVAGRVGQGRAWAFSGANGKLLYELNDPNPQGTATDTARFGSRIGSAGDLTGDGVPDLIVGASNQDVPSGCGAVSPTPPNCHKHQGQAFIFNGATGTLIRTLNLPSEDQVKPPCTSSCGTFGLAVQSVPGEPGPASGSSPSAPTRQRQPSVVCLGAADRPGAVAGGDHRRGDHRRAHSSGSEHQDRQPADQLAGQLRIGIRRPADATSRRCADRNT